MLTIQPQNWPGLKTALLYYATSIAQSGVWAEFGVWKGNSAKFLAKLLPDNGFLYLYDSFEGLPSDWIAGYPKGTFKCEPPIIDSNKVEIRKGLFADTIKGGEVFSFVHIDCDLYESAKIVLSRISLHSGLVLVFDEYELGEKQALIECIKGKKYTELMTTGYGQVCVKID